MAEHYAPDLSSPGADEGISCAVCHSIVRTDVEGNANYVLTPPRRYLNENSFLGKFLIRAYPREHKVTYGRPLLKTPEFSEMPGSDRTVRLTTGDINENADG